VWVKKNEEPGPRGSAGNFLLDEEMEGDPPEREVVEGGGIDVLLEINDSNKCCTLLLRTT
jgi:hypothetical protein